MESTNYVHIIRIAKFKLPKYNVWSPDPLEGGETIVYLNIHEKTCKLDLFLINFIDIADGIIIRFIKPSDAHNWLVD